MAACTRRCRRAADVIHANVSFSLQLVLDLGEWASFEKIGVSMNEPAPALPATTGWLLRSQGRWLTSLLAVGLVAVATAGLPLQSRLFLSFDVAAIVYVGLFAALISKPAPAPPVRKWNVSKLSGIATLVAVFVLSLIGITAVATLQRLNSAPHWMKMLHLAASLAALCLAWIWANIQFSLFYMGLYYSDTTPDDHTSPFDEGMAYPDRNTPDYWDFIYYSFTIAMCYQTSDVAITTTTVRRVTLLHAIFSFFFFTAIVGLVVNILSNNF